MRTKKIFFTVVFAAAILMFFGAGATNAKAEEGSVVYETVGFLYTSSMYDAQVILGLTADAIQNKIYEDDVTRQIIEEQVGLLSGMKDNAQKLAAEFKAAGEDAAIMYEIISCIEKLEDTAATLKQYIDEPTQENADLFQEKRALSYDSIKKLMEPVEESK